MKIKSLMIVILFVNCYSGKHTKIEQGYDRNNINRIDILMDSDCLNAKMLIDHLRPIWFLERGRKSFMDEYPVRIYKEGSEEITKHSLMFIKADDILEIKYYDRYTAPTFFGLNHPNGAIVIRMFNKGAKERQ